MSKKIVSIICFCSWIVAILNAQQPLSKDNFKVFDDNGRVIQKIEGGQIVEEIEYPTSTPIVVADVEVFLPILKPLTYAYTFEAGDTILLEVRTIKGSRLRSVQLINSQGGVTHSALDVNKKDCFCKRIEIKESDNFSLEILSRYVNLKHKVAIKIIRYPKVEPIIYDIVSDTIYSDKPAVTTSTKVISRDTLLYQITDETNLITNKLDLEKQPFTTIPISVPIALLDSIKYLTYWIGLSSTDTSNYLLTESAINLAENFIAKTTSPALVAYAFDPRTPLPANTNSNIDYAFLDLNNQFKFSKKRKSEYRTLFGSKNMPPANFGQIPMKHFLAKYPRSTQKRQEKQYNIPPAEAYQFFLAFKNNSSVNTYPIKVKIIGVGFKENTATTVTETKKILEVKKYKIQRLPKIPAETEE